MLYFLDLCRGVIFEQGQKDLWDRCATALLGNERRCSQADVVATTTAIGQHGVHEGRIVVVGDDDLRQAGFQLLIERLLIVPGDESAGGGRGH